jgi:hypothetical protein
VQTAFSIADQEVSELIAAGGQVRPPDFQALLRSLGARVEAEDAAAAPADGPRVD